MLSIIPKITDTVYLKVYEKFEDSQGVNGRRTDNTMAIQKTDEMTNNDLQNTTQKTEIAHHEP